MVSTMPEKGTITLLGIYKTPPFPSSSNTLWRQMLHRKFSINCYNWLLVHFLLWHDFVHSFFRNSYRHSFCFLLFPNNVKIWDGEQHMNFVNIDCCLTDNKCHFIFERNIYYKCYVRLFFTLWNWNILYYRSRSNTLTW